MSHDPNLHRAVVRYSVDVFISISILVLIGYLALSIIAPFLSVVVWGVIMAVGVYPAYVWLRGKMGPLSGWASFLVAIIGLVVLFVPTVMIVNSVVDSVASLAQSLSSGEFKVPAPKESVKDWLLIGPPIYEAWSNAATNLAGFLKNYSSEVRGFATSLLSMGAGMAIGVLQFAVSIIFAAIFMSFADPLVKLTDQLVARIASDRGSAMLVMAGQTARNVTKGVVGIAFIQGGLGAIGVFAVGMPYAGVVAALLVGSSLIQAPPLVFIPAIIYVWSAEPTLTAVIFTAYMLPVLFSDNILKPVLMSRGLETPMVVILIGVIGGTISGGLIGLFTGPVILAVFHKMVTMWIESVSQDPDQPSEEAPKAAD